MNFISIITEIDEQGNALDQNITPNFENQNDIEEFNPEIQKSRKKAVRQKLSSDDQKTLSMHRDEQTRFNLTTRRDITHEAILNLLQDPSPLVKAGLIMNNDIPDYYITHLQSDPDEMIQNAFATRKAK